MNGYDEIRSLLQDWPRQLYQTPFPRAEPPSLNELHPNNYTKNSQLSIKTCQVNKQSVTMNKSPGYSDEVMDETHDVIHNAELEEQKVRQRDSSAAAALYTDYDLDARQGCIVRR